MTRSSPYNNPQVLGHVGSTPVVAQLGDGWGDIITVHMLSDYVLLDGFLPERPPAGTASYTNKGLPRTVLAGTNAQFFKAESDALIDAGFASHVSG